MRKITWPAGAALSNVMRNVDHDHATHPLFTAFRQLKLTIVTSR